MTVKQRVRELNATESAPDQCQPTSRGTQPTKPEIRCAYRGDALKLMPDYIPGFLYADS